jgi:hypothetical protein
MNTRILRLAPALPLALLLTACGHHHVTVSSLASPTSSAVQADKAQAEAAVKACFPQTVTGIRELKAHARRVAVLDCLAIPKANRAAFETQLEKDILAVHSSASLKAMLEVTIPAQVEAARK